MSTTMSTNQWQMRTCYWGLVVTGFLHSIEQCSNLYQILVAEKIGIELHDTLAGNRYGFSGTCFWIVCRGPYDWLIDWLIDWLLQCLDRCSGVTVGVAGVTWRHMLSAVSSFRLICCVQCHSVDNRSTCCLFLVHNTALGFCSLATFC